MATWSEFEAAEPEMARAARELLSVPGFGFAYLATVAPDGGPRIHPVNLVWVDGALAAFIVPSPKLEDLRRPPRRYALHSTGSADVDDELAVRGRAREIDDPARRAVAVAACPFTPGDDHALVELDLDRVLWGHSEPRGTFPPRYRRWRVPDAD
jgi:Pyridoxamine 5'-phosphate oxidase